MYAQNERIYVRLGKSERDRTVAEHLAVFMDNGGNASDLVKSLLYSFFTGKGDGLSGLDIPRPPANEDKERERKLSSKLKKISFGGLGH